MTNETFLDNVSWLDNLKVRFSYGQSGNQAIDPNQTATTANPVRYPFGGVIRTGVLAGRLGNANLNWETTTSANLGIDFSLWAGRPER